MVETLVSSLEGIDERGHISDSARDAVMQALRTHFRPEFLNRVDETVLFKPLTLDEITGVVELLAKELCERLSQQGIVLEISQEAEGWRRAATCSTSI
jgi:ATP-dependent Clp protease ATP-binding subunit ClpB